MKTCSLPFIIITVLLLVSLLAPRGSAADPPPVQWQQVLGGSSNDIAQSIRQTDDGGYILAGTTTSRSGSYADENLDILVMKLDSAGNLQWQKVFGESTDDGASGIQQTSDGGYILTGYTGVSRYRNALVLRLDSGGNLEWQKVLGGNAEDSGSGIQQTIEGGYIMVGTTASSGTGDVGVNHGSLDVWVVKLSSAGNIGWQRVLGGYMEDTGSGIQQTDDGGYILVGTTESDNSGDVGTNHGNQDVWAVKLDSAGYLQWQKVLGGGDSDRGTSIRQTAGGEYILTGYTLSSNTGDVGMNNGRFDVWAVKLDSAGDLQWQNVLGGSAYDYGTGIWPADDGGFILTGYTSSGISGDVGINHGLNDVWAVKLGSAGELVWERPLGGYGNDRGNSIQQTDDGGYILAGQTESSNTGDVGANHGASDVWVVRLLPDITLTATPTVTTPVPSVGEATSSYKMGFSGLSYNADGKNTLDLDLKSARRSQATVAVYADRVEIYQKAPAGILMTFRGTDFAVQTDRVTGAVRSADFITDPVEAPLTPGMVSGSVRAVFPELTQAGTIRATVSDRPDTSLLDQFRSILEQDGLELDTVAYTYDVRKSNMPKTGSANVTLTLPESWLKQHGGISAVRIIRVSDTTGVAELVPAVYNGTDKKGIMQFQGVSANGTSVFGLITLKASKMAQENDPDLAIVPLQQPAITTIVGMFSWLLASLQQNPAGAIALVATAGAAYAGRMKGMW